MTARSLCAALLVLSLSSAAGAADLGVRANHLVIRETPGKTSIRFSAHNDAGIQKGPAGSTSSLSNSTFELFYGDDPGNLGKFVLRASDWELNDATKAEFVGTNVETLDITNGKRLKLQTQTLGDVPSWTLDLIGGGKPSDSGGITTILTILNNTDSSVHRMCTRFAIAAGSAVSSRITRDGGRRLVARRGVPVSCDRLSFFRMEPGQQRGFFSAPWPNDTRLFGDGSLDLAGFPVPAGNAIVDDILAQGSSITKGFGTNSAVFFQSAAPLDTGTLPSPEDSVLDGSAVMLVNLDNPSAPRTPLLLNLKTSAGILRPPDLLSVLPYPGHPLLGETTHAAILFSGIETPAGMPFVPAPLLAELDDPWDASKPVDAIKWAALKAQRDAVYAYVNAHTSWSSSQVVAFTVFTTQDVTGELEAMAASVNAMPAPTPLSRTTGNCGGGALRTTVSGQLRLPKFQTGVYPYVFSGGGIVVASGLALQQSTEDVNFGMTFPCGPAPSNGWPILLFQSGTGGGVNSSNISQLGGNSPTNPLPYAVVSIAPLYSGDRYVPGLPVPFDQSEFLFFNYFNAIAGRTNQIQQAAEMIYLRRIAEGIVLSAAETGNGSPVQTDDSIEVIAGHSQGALTIPQLLAVDPSFDGAFISAGGGGLYQTLLHRQEVRIPLTLVIGPGAVEMDQFHPLPHLVQTFVEIGDAANYSPLATNAHIVSTSGLLDGCSPVEAISIIGTAMGLAVANPLYFPVFGSSILEPPTVALPVSGNLLDGRTGVTVQLDTGHFGASTNPQLGRSFVDSLAAGGVPTAELDPILTDTNAGCARYDQLP